MGLDTKILEEVLANCPLPLAAEASSLIEPPIVGPCAFAEDVLTIIPYNPGKNNGWYTSLEYYQMFWKPFSQELSSRCHSVVASIDASGNVPQEKERTQKARLIAKARAKQRAKERGQETAKPLPNDFEFTDDSSFHFESLRESSGAVKQRLYKYFLDKAKCQSYPMGRNFYFEFDHHAPWKFSGIEPSTRDDSSEHYHGESDPALIYWLERLAYKNDGEHSTFIMRTTDSDIIPICMWSIELDLKLNKSSSIIRKPIYWKRKTSAGPDKGHDKRDQWVEMRTCYKIVTETMKLDATEYMIYCICCGTDYFQRDSVFYGFGPPKILAAIRAMTDTSCGRKNQFDVFKLEGSQKNVMKEMTVFMELVRRVYTNHYTKSVDGLRRIVTNKNNAGLGLSKYNDVLSHRRLEELERDAIAKAERAKKTREARKPPNSKPTKEKRPIRLPSNEVIIKAYRDLDFNHRYWKDRAQWPQGMNGVPVPKQATTEEEEAEMEDAPAAASTPHQGARMMRTAEEADASRKLTRLLDIQVKKITAAASAESDASMAEEITIEADEEEEEYEDEDEDEDEDCVILSTDDATEHDKLNGFIHRASDKKTRSGKRLALDTPLQRPNKKRKV